MKQALRISILMFGLLGTFLSVATPQVPTPDGGPIILCPEAKCQSGGLPPL